MSIHSTRDHCTSSASINNLIEEQNKKNIRIGNNVVGNAKSKETNGL